MRQRSVALGRRDYAQDSEVMGRSACRTNVLVEQLKNILAEHRCDTEYGVKVGAQIPRAAGHWRTNICTALLRSLGSIAAVGGECSCWTVMYLSTHLEKS